jgi:signal transduction protein with GAF and PtsI domain
MTANLTYILQEICLSMGWKYGEAWVPDGDVLRCHPAYYMASQEIASFRRESEDFTFRSGAGLPGRVWLLQEPEWIENVSEQPAIYYRSHIAKPVGLKAAVGVPIQEAGNVKMVLVFYSDRIQPPSETAIANLMAQIQSLLMANGQ